MLWGHRRFGFMLLGSRRLTRPLAVASVFALGCALPQLASAAGAAGTAAATAATSPGYSQTPSTTEPYAACPLPKPGHVQCLSIIVPPGTARSGLQFNAPSQGVQQARQSFTQSGQMVPEEETARAAHGSSEAAKGVALSGFGLEGSGEYGGLAPADLRSAYRLPATGGSGQTVAIVDAFNDPTAQADLQKYREKYKLVYKGTETACTEANGCFKKVDQTGETEAEAKEHSKAFPANEPGWSEEISLDLDMVSAVCPECHILLVEATNSESGNMYLAEDEAATLKATEISNSWGGPESSGETAEDKYFVHENASHERIPITVAAGDEGYGVSYPAASKDVISVGGTLLYKTPFYERGWSEEAWWETGSGCSTYELKESWQSTGCGEKGENRVDNDVAAVASVESPVSMYDTFEAPGWLLVGGTSVSSPVVAGVEALSSAAVRAEGAGAFYKHPSALFDVTVGSNWRLFKEKPCSPEFLCTAATGYDGPTGNGTPDLEEGGKGGLLEKWYDVTMPGYESQSFAVSCWSSTKCISVGSEGRYVVSDNWGGTEWNPARWPLARPSGAVEMSVPAVSCTTETCIAVGSWTESKGYARALAETSNGSEWVNNAVPLPESTVRSLLTGVSCTAATACTAVGSYLVGTAYKIFAERFNGKAWSVESMPQPSNASVAGVSCSSATSCVAVGSYYNSTTFATEALTEIWNGSAWSTHTPTIAGATESGLTTVSCTAATACTEAGWYKVESKEDAVTLVERWNGSEWSKQTFLRPKGAPFEPDIGDVACASATSCEAVGWTQTAPFSLAAAATVESWNGTGWTIQETPVSESAEVRLHGLSCPSTTVCMATGSLTTSEHFPYAGTKTNLAYSLAEGTWTAKPMSENVSGSSSVSCAGAAECMAVGNAAPKGAGEEEAISQVWNGAAWANLPVATPSETVSFKLSGIACPSLGECTAVGSYVNGVGTRVPLAERAANVERDAASEWSLQAAPTPAGAKASSLAGVSCASSKSCVAVGSYTNSSGTEVTLAEGWNGTEWSLQTTPTPAGAKASSLAGVSCVSSKSCVAVGSYMNSSGTAVALAEGWNGTEWSLQTTPELSGGRPNKLSGVSCFSETGCTAVGQDHAQFGGLESLAMGWNGTAWAIQTTQNGGDWDGDVGLTSVSCSSATSCMAVGFDLGGPVETLAEFWNGTEWAIQPITNPSEATEDDLASVSCSAPPLCMAVGHTATKKEYILPSVTNLSELRAEPLAPPLVATEPATAVTKVQATLDGNVDPNGSEAKYYFEYGTTEAYGSKTAEVTAGSGTSRLEESQVVTGLSAKTTYDFRIVAKSSHGTTHGANHVFVTTS
jgi:hypothetical protein